MLSWRLQTGSEKAELQELNARLYDYVCRVRELERENQLMEEELRGRRGQEDLWAEGQARFAEEARSLRLQLDELSWATALAEGERDALRRELLELQRLGSETRAARGRLDAELGAQRRELQEALSARAALEALLGRLQAEHRGLEAAHERDVRELRARAAAGLTMHYRARVAGPAAPPPRLREVHDSYALLVAESWRETVQLYEDEVRQLEEALRRGQESRRQAEEETRLCAQEAEALRGQALELEELRARLEDELMRRSEEYRLQVEERQRVIECLEDEKAALTAVMADRLRDYQELVQVKTGLSLEVATYRALLEGESNPEILIWTKHIETMPQEFRNTSYRYSDSVLQRENERNRFPRQKVPLANLNHGSALHSNLSGHLGSQTTTSMESAGRRGFPGSSPSSVSTTWQENSYEKTISSQTNSRTFSPTYGLSRNTDVSVKTFPDRSKTEGRRDVSTVVQESHRERRDRAVAGASESTRSKERTVILEKKTEVDVTRERERNRPGAIRKKQEEMLFDSKEKASEERNLRWEELTKLDKEARKRETQQMTEKAKGKDALKERHVKERDIPIHLEGPQARRPAEVTPKGLQTPVKKDADDGSGRQKETREARFKLSPSDPADSLEGDSTTETVAENIVTSILKQFTQTSNTEATANSFPDTKVIYVEKKELPGDKKTKTEIVLESKLTEDVDISDQAGLDYLLSKEAKEVGLKGKSTEQMIGDIINLGLKGRDGRARVVNVEIVEEPMSYVGGEKAGEFSTPFEVEEVDDVSPDPKGFTEEEGSYGETDGTFLGHPRHRTRQENVTHVEEVMEAGDSEGEQSYFVSTPEEHPGGPDRDDDEGSVYGQIHIEEESTIRYSWQDEIVQGSWRRRKQGDHEGEKIMNVPEASPADAERTHWTEQSRSGEFHAEPTITEKEIKIPHEFHASIKGVSSKEPRHQLVEVIGQLEQTLPERVKEELSALTREEDSELGGVLVDVKKVQTPGSGSVTLVAEVNLSQTVDADQLDVEQLSRDEASEIEKTVESVVRDNVTRRQGQAPGSPDRDERMESPVSGLGFKRWATRELYSPSGEREDGGRASYSMEQLSPQGPVSATVEVSSPQGFAQSVRHVQLGPTAFWKTEQVSYEGPTVQVAQVSGEDVPSQAAILVGTSLSLRPLMLGLEPSQVSREVFLQGPIPSLQEVGSAEELEAPDLSTDANLSGKQGSFGFQQVRVEKAAIVQGSTSGAGKVGDESASTQTSVSHLQVGPKHGFSEPIQLTVPLSDRTGLGIETGSVNTEGSSGIHTSVGHISITPRGHQGAEWVVDPGLVPHPVEFRDPDSAIPLQGSAAVTQVTTTHTLGSKTFMTEKSTFQRVALESPREDGSGDTSGADVTSGVSRSFRHIQLGPTDTDTSEHIVIRAPASVTRGLAGSARLPERGDPADGSRTLRLIDLGPKETSFTFQMDVSNVEATPRWTPGAGTEGEAPSASGWGAWRDAGSTCDPASGTSFQAAAGDRHQAQGEQHTEEATFDKTVQLQRMVDQRSVISDDKKVALLYLDKEEEEDDGHWF